MPTKPILVKNQQSHSILGNFCNFCIVCKSSTIDLLRFNQRWTTTLCRYLRFRNTFRGICLSSCFRMRWIMEVSMTGLNLWLSFHTVTFVFKIVVSLIHWVNTCSTRLIKTLHFGKCLLKRNTITLEQRYEEFLLFFSEKKSMSGGKSASKPLKIPDLRHLRKDIQKVSQEREGEVTKKRQKETWGRGAAKKLMSPTHPCFSWGSGN